MVRAADALGTGRRGQTRAVLVCGSDTAAQHLSLRLGEPRPRAYHTARRKLPLGGRGRVKARCHAVRAALGSPDGPGRGSVDLSTGRGGPGGEIPEPSPMRGWSYLIPVFPSLISKGRAKLHEFCKEEFSPP